MAHRRPRSPQRGGEYGADAPDPRRRRMNGPRAFEHYNQPQQHDQVDRSGNRGRRQFPRSEQPEAQTPQTRGSDRDQEPPGRRQGGRPNAMRTESHRNRDQQLRSDSHDHARQAYHRNRIDTPNIEKLEEVIPHISDMSRGLGVEEQGMLVSEILQIKLPVNANQTYSQRSGTYSNSHHCLEMIFNSSRAQDPDFLPSVNSLIREFRERTLDETDYESIKALFAKYLQCCAFLQCHFLHSQYAYKDGWRCLRCMNDNGLTQASERVFSGNVCIIMHVKSCENVADGGTFWKKPFGLLGTAYIERHWGLYLGEVGRMRLFFLACSFQDNVEGKIRANPELAKYLVMMWADEDGEPELPDGVTKFWRMRGVTFFRRTLFDVRNVLSAEAEVLVKRVPGRFASEKGRAEAYQMVRYVFIQCTEQQDWGPWIPDEDLPAGGLKDDGGFWRDQPEVAAARMMLDPSGGTMAQSAGGHEQPDNDSKRRGSLSESDRGAPGKDVKGSETESVSASSQGSSSTESTTPPSAPESEPAEQSDRNLQVRKQVKATTTSSLRPRLEQAALGAIVTSEDRTPSGTQGRSIAETGLDSVSARLRASSSSPLKGHANMPRSPSNLATLSSMDADAAAESGEEVDDWEDMGQNKVAKEKAKFEQ